MEAEPINRPYPSKDLDAVMAESTRDFDKA
jgi:hypothetical protein